MRVLVCVKRVPAPGGRIGITPDGQDVDTTHLGFTMSPHEECAVEEAVRITDRLGGEATVLTLGPPEAEEQLRYAVSLGIHKAVLVETDTTDWDPQRTSAAIAHTIRELEADNQPFDLVLVGNESADSGGYQVGIRVAHALGRPMVNGVKGIEFSDGGLVARRPFGGGSEVYGLPLPAMVGVKEGINLPRYPTMKGRLQSRKVAVERFHSDAQPGGQTKIRLIPPEEQHSETLILGHGPEAADKVVDLLDELGVL